MTVPLRPGRVTREATRRDPAATGTTGSGTVDGPVRDHGTSPVGRIAGSPGAASTRRVSVRAPFAVGFFAAAGALAAYWVGGLLLSIGNLLVLVVVALFLAAGLNPGVESLVRRGLRRSLAVLAVTVAVLVVIALFFVALVPVIAEQVGTLIDNSPSIFERLRQNPLVTRLDEQFGLVDKATDFIRSGDFGQQVFGGAVGVGVAVFSALANAFIVVVLTLYFLASLNRVKEAGYRLAPASRRGRVRDLGDRIVRSIGAYVSGAFVVAMCAGISSLIFLFIVGLGDYAIALAAVVALLDVVPMIGATLGAVVVTLIGFATDPGTGLACVVFYVVYQQVENYLVYPRVMSRAVDIPGSAIVIAAVVGAGLLGVVGALLAIPTAAAILLIVREVVMPRMEHR